MVVPTWAVDKFKNRNLRDFNWIKDCSEKELDNAMKELPVYPKLNNTPRKHQKASFLIGTYMNQFMYLLDLGVGKTFVSLSLVSYKKEMGDPCKTLVLVPYITSITEWEEQIEMHTPHLDYIGLYGSTEERERLLDSQNPDIFILNYPGIVHLCTSKAKNKKTGKNQLIVDKDKLEWVSEKFDIVILDEITACKNHRSTTYQICNGLTDRVPVRYGLTGTPMSRNPHDLWAPFHIIDKGETLGKTLGIFRASFFSTTRNPWGGYEHKFLKKYEKDLYRMIRNCSIRYQENEVKELPPKVYVPKHLDLSKEVTPYYDKQYLVIKNAKGDKKVIKKAFNKLRQLSSGFIYMEDEDETKTKNKNKKPVEFKNNPKLESLLELIESMPDDKKMVVFHDFIFSGDLIGRHLKKIKEDYIRIYSGTKDKKEALQKFKTDPNCRVALINNQSGAMGLNLQIANYVVFYESPVSPMIRTQAEKRCHRSGQEDRVFIYDLIVRDTVDEQIQDFLKEGRDLMSSIVDGEIKPRKKDEPKG